MIVQTIRDIMTLDKKLVVIRKEKSLLSLNMKEHYNSVRITRNSRQIKPHRLNGKHKYCIACKIKKQRFFPNYFFYSISNYFRRLMSKLNQEEIDIAKKMRRLTSRVKYPLYAFEIQNRSDGYKMRSTS